MLAAVIREFGGPEVLQLEQVDKPAPGAHEVLVQVRAVRVGGLLDVGTRAGRNHFARIEFPHILGSDFAGEVVAVGRNVDARRVGQRVAVSPFVPCGSCEHCLAGRDDSCPKAELIGVHRSGSYAEFAVAPDGNVWEIPDSTSLEDGATLALSGPVAFTQFHLLGLAPGEWVLVTAGASGLGSVTAKVARLFGARVIATSRTPWKRSELAKMGLDAVLDTDAPDFFESVMAITGGEGVRIAIDNIASSTMWPKVMTVLAPGGTVVSSGALAAEIVPLDLRSLYTKSQSVIGIRTATHSGIRGFWELAKHGIHPLIDRTFPFARIADAHSYVEAQSNLGRVLVTM